MKFSIEVINFHRYRQGLPPLAPRKKMKSAKPVRANNNNKNNKNNIINNNALSTSVPMTTSSVKVRRRVHWSFRLDKHEQVVIFNKKDAAFARNVGIPFDGDWFYDARDVEWEDEEWDNCRVEEHCDAWRRGAWNEDENNEDNYELQGEEYPAHEGNNTYMPMPVSTDTTTADEEVISAATDEVPIVPTDFPSSSNPITLALLGSIWVHDPKHGLVRRSARLRARG